MSLIELRNELHKSKLIRHLSRDQQADLVGETLAILFVKYGAVVDSDATVVTQQAREEYASYAFGILRNLARGRFRQRVRDSARVFSLSQLDEIAAIASRDDFERKEGLARIREYFHDAIVHTLSSKEREIIQQILNNRSIPDIVSEGSESRASVYRSYASAISKLQRAMSQHKDLWTAINEEAV